MKITNRPCTKKEVKEILKQINEGYTMSKDVISDIIDLLTKNQLEKVIEVIEQKEDSNSLYDSVDYILGEEEDEE